MSGPLRRDFLTHTAEAFSVHFYYRLLSLKDDRQRFLQQVSKKQFQTLYHNENTWVAQMDE